MLDKPSSPVATERIGHRDGGDRSALLEESPLEGQPSRQSPRSGSPAASDFKTAPVHRELELRGKAQRERCGGYSVGYSRPVAHQLVPEQEGPVVLLDRARVIHREGRARRGRRSA